ncbi:YqiJ family protein, partial [Escherichia coli]|nr:YqiJ family protein [Escherichia coli]MEA0503723.1 YqiJ family protein [Escherichia coli]
MILFADYNTPYLFAISFVLLIGLLEIFALICGHMLSGALDAHLDHYDSITTGHISQWICPYISRHLLSLNPLQARCRRYSRGER